MSKKQWQGRVFLGRENGQQRFYWVGRFPTRRERDKAVAKAITERPWEKPLAPDGPTCDEWADRYLELYAERHKHSSYETATHCLKRFRKDFGSRPLRSITRLEAEDWCRRVPKSALPRVVAMFNYAVEMEIIGRNPFAGFGGDRSRGRSEQDPPTEQEMRGLLDACDVLGDYAPQMRALILVGAYTGMRPGELYELRWSDIDLATNRIVVSRRLYKGRVDTPKNGAPKRIALVPPARGALLRQPTRTGELVFLSKRGCRLCSSTVANYFGLVRAAAGAPDSWDFYLVTKHYGVALLYRLGLSTRAISSQMGWSEKSVDSLLAVYGHKDLVALAEVDALYERQRDGSDVEVEHGGANAL